MHVDALLMVLCKMWDAGQVWKSKVQGIRCGAKVRGAGRRSTLVVLK